MTKKNEVLSLSKAKIKLSFCNVCIALLSVVAIVFLYIQSFWTVKVSYTLSSEQLQKILAESGTEISVTADDLKNVDLEVNTSLSLKGEDLSKLLVDEIKLVPQLFGNKGEDADGVWTKMMQTCRENQTVENTVKTTVEGLVEQTEQMVPKMVSVYVKVMLREQMSRADANPSDPSKDGTTSDNQTNEVGEQTAERNASVSLAYFFEDVADVGADRTEILPSDLPGGITQDDVSSFLTNEDVAKRLETLDMEQLEQVIGNLLSRDNISVEEGTSIIMDFLESNKETLELTDADLASVKTEVSSVLTEVAGEDGNINVDKAVTEVLVNQGVIDKDQIQEGDELSDVLTAYFMEQLGETKEYLYIAFLSFSLLIGVLYILWGILFVKSFIKIFTGRPTGAFFVKALTALPYILLVLIPTVAMLFKTTLLPLLLEKIAADTSQIMEYMNGLTVSFGGCWVPALCTLILFLFGFLYSSFKREYKKAKKAAKKADV